MTPDELAAALYALDGISDPLDRRQRQAQLLNSVATRVAIEAIDLLEVRRGKSREINKSVSPPNKGFRDF